MNLLLDLKPENAPFETIESKAQKEFFKWWKEILPLMEIERICEVLIATPKKEGVFTNITE